jgi:Flp pilus assembly protein TadG
MIHDSSRRSTLAAEPFGKRRRCYASRVPHRVEARAGVAAVELAVCLPVLVLFVIGAVECCSMIYVDQTLAVASYEGARAAIRFDGTNAEVETKCETILTARRVLNPTITTDPANVSDAPRGTEVSVTVSAPCRENGVLTSWFFGDKTLTETSKMIKE